jgi:hypothetical protein
MPFIFFRNLFLGYRYAYRSHQIIQSYHSLSIQSIQNAFGASTIGIICVTSEFYDSPSLDHSAFKLGTKSIDSRVTEGIMVVTTIAAMFIHWPWIYPILMIIGRITAILETKIFKRNTSAQNTSNDSQIEKKKAPKSIGII